LEKKVEYLLQKKNKIEFQITLGVGIVCKDKNAWEKWRDILEVNWNL
jgi:hypothetical protein